MQHIHDDACEMLLPGDPSPGPIANLRTGLLVLADELRWTALGWLRAIEIRQLRKRLRQEYGHLGQSIHDGPDTEAGLAARQVEFLQGEIDHLRQELERKRVEFVASRCKRLHLTR